MIMIMYNVAKNGFVSYNYYYTYAYRLGIIKILGHIHDE
jgi:hypothetical protein